MESIKAETCIEVSLSGELPYFEETEARAKITGYSLCKQILVDTINNEIAGTPDIYLSISMCGRTVDYATPDDIPNESVLCSCGNHWLIRYRDLR